MKKFFIYAGYYFAGLLSFALICYPLYRYIDKFKPNGISDNPEDWGQFGDFIGGTTNVIIGFLNIVATIILALVIKNLDDSRSKIKDDEDKRRHLELIDLEKLRHKQNLDLQVDLFNRNIKHEFQKKISENLNKLLILISDYNVLDNRKKILLLIDTINTDLNNCSILFKNERINNIIKRIHFGNIIIKLSLIHI